MAEFTDREHYIPLRKSDLVAMLCKDAKLQPQERDAFRQFGRLVGAIWHFEYLETLDRLKDEYAPFDPDAATQPLETMLAEKRPAAMEVLFDDVVKLMEKANFKRLSRKDIQDAVEGGASDWGINMHVEWDVFERLEVFIRGDAKTTRTRPHPVWFWREIEKEVDTYQRLVLLVKLRKHKRLPNSIDVEDVFLKMFKDIPKLDLEMVLPGTSLQMPLTSKLTLGGSLIGALGYGLYQVAFQIYVAVKTILGLALSAVAVAASTALSVLWTPFVVLGTIAYKQYASYQVTKQKYSKQLTESLYFQNLDNNLGVLTQLVDEAEEQECRETLLAYFYLWKYAPASGWTKEQLDDYVELELEGKLKMKVDFEVDDAIAKLVKLGIVRQIGENYTAVSITEALEKLDSRWDNYFKYANR